MLLTALIVYHVVFCLSSAFLSFFQLSFYLTASSSQLVVVRFWFLTALIFYHVLVRLSSTFFNTVRHPLLSVCHSVFSTASVFYHTVFCLSRSFLRISNYLFCLNFQNNSFICFVSNSFVSITLLSLFVNYFFTFLKNISK